MRRRFRTCTITVLPEPARYFSFHTASYSSTAVTVRPRFWSRYARMAYSVSVRATGLPLLVTLCVEKSTSRFSTASASSGLPRYSLYRRISELTLASSSTLEKGLDRKSSPPLE